MDGKDIKTKRLIYENNLLPSYRKAWHKNYKGDSTLKDDFLACYDDDTWRVCSNLTKSRSRKAKRCRTKVGKCVLEGKGYFFTLTFSDDTLAKTSEKTRRRYVARFLKGICDKYVANIDYGGKNGREHYHAVGLPFWWTFDTYKVGKRMYEDMPNCKDWSKYGFFEIRKVGNTEADMKKVANYTAKLSAHALKDTTLQGKPNPRLITSRKRLKLNRFPRLD